MFTVKIKGAEFKADEETAIREWMRGARVYDKDGREAVGVEDTKVGARFMF